MSQHHERKPRPRRVAEPVQVYLEPPARDRLARLTTLLGTTKSEVMRRGLEALERQLSNPAEHPALRIIGIAGALEAGDPGYDVAREHDRFIADTEIEVHPRRPSRAPRAGSRSKRGG